MNLDIDKNYAKALFQVKLINFFFNSIKYF
ncbi:unnamed protein product [Onchocerca flexuosa]|uniref:NADH dehydrogenase subunit 4L n=1 Tax=Onchocerca flexuosa TaxID=387005 RepID=A0A183HUR8_9BILA|nr:unnamed protein product [Onchocerca flexuosa]